MGKGIDEMFGESRMSRGSRKVALAIIKDSDGDLALLRVNLGVDGDVQDVRCLGWIKDDECADELRDIVLGLQRGDLAAAQGVDARKLAEKLMEGGF